MNSTAARIPGLRRIALVAAAAGIAALGGLAVAPSASAAEVVPGVGQNGPDAFLVFDHGRQPIFFCDDSQPQKQHNICIDVTVNRF